MSNSGQSAEKVNKMRRSSGRVVLNKGYKDDQSTWKTPMQLKSTGKHTEEDKGNTKKVDDSRNLYENIECQKSIKPQSNRRLVWLPIVACLISIVALLLGLLMFSGEIGYRCDCSANKGTKSMATHSDKIRSSEKNTIIMTMDLLKNYESDLNQLKSALNKTNDDLAELENAAAKLNSSTYQLVPEVDAAKNELAILNSTVTTLLCFNNPCKNGGTWYPGNATCNFKCVCAAGYFGKLCEKRALCKFDFEDGIGEWVRTGTAFNNQPTYGDNPTARNIRQPANQQGDWWIGGFENRPNKSVTAGQKQGDGPQGTLTSPSFKIIGQAISFLIGGGCDVNVVRVELIVGNQTVRTATGYCHETMARKIWDVREFTGRHALLKLVDFSSGHWGHINFDDLDICLKIVFCKFDFEDGIDGWNTTGTVFNNQPTYGDNPTARNRGQPANQQGDWWIGGAENRPNKSVTAGQTQGDGPQGTLTSPSFKIIGQTISFLIGGGCDVNVVRVELIVGNQVVGRATGGCTETMTRKTWHVREFIDQNAHFKLVDFSSGGWGHINFDDLEGEISCSV